MRKKGGAREEDRRETFWAISKRVCTMEGFVHEVFVMVEGMRVSSVCLVEPSGYVKAPFKLHNCLDITFTSSFPGLPSILWTPLYSPTSLPSFIQIFEARGLRIGFLQRHVCGDA